MTTLVTNVRAVLAENRAASATEYALMGGILAVGLVAAFGHLVTKLTNTFGALTF